MSRALKLALALVVGAWCVAAWLYVRYRQHRVAKAQAQAALSAETATKRAEAREAASEGFVGALLGRGGGLGPGATADMVTGQARAVAVFADKVKRSGGKVSDFHEL